MLEKTNWKEKFGIECYGAAIGMKTDRENLKFELVNILPEPVEICGFKETDEILTLNTDGGAESNGLYLAGECVLEFDEYNDSLTEFVADKILMILAKKSLPAKIYLHAGGVLWNGSGILIPGFSFAGKTTLVKEFIKAGAVYYSDDCIVLDDEGFLLPFAKPLAIRTDEGRVFHAADYFGADTGRKRAKLNLILFTSFEENAVWNPQRMSRGKGILELMNNFYYRGSVGLKPAEIMRVLTEITSETRMFAGKRKEAAEVVRWVSDNF